MTLFDCRVCGMGDAIVALWMAEGARAEGHEVAFLEGSHTDLVRAFGHRHVPVGTAGRTMLFGGDAPAYHEELRLSEKAATRPVQWQSHCGFKAPPKRPVLVERSAQWAQWAEGIKRDRTPLGQPLVLLFPVAAYSTRCWPLQKWTRLAWYLNDNGYAPVAMHTHKTELESMPFFAHGYPIEAAIELIALADVVVANDSGPAHLAGTMGVRTIAAVGPTDPDVVFGYCPQIEPIRVGTVGCVGCHFAYAKGFRSICDQGCEALHMLPVTAVAHRVMQTGRDLKIA